ncbi:MAG TPA: hypothetical protein VG028_13365 [Terriglobia bacterium]|nr:hypothetical protein [Terriglobia bacterium]
MARRCRECGCTNEVACGPGDYWVEWDLCSYCAQLHESLSRGLRDDDPAVLPPGHVETESGLIVPNSYETL